MTGSRNGKIQSVERAAAILECFKERPLLGITDIRKKVDLPKSTVFGLVDTLASCGYLTQDPESGKYKLGLELYRLAQYIDEDLRTVAIPYLRELVDEFGETANLVRHDGTHIIYVEKLESRHAMRICTTQGQFLPFYCSGVGRAILACLNEEEIRLAVDSYSYAPYTAKTVRDAETLLRQLDPIRSQGYSVDDEEFEVGLLCVGVAILTPQGRPIGGISVSGPKTRMDPKTVDRIAGKLKKDAISISRTLY